MRRNGEIMKIKALIMDVDGTLTDGGIYLDATEAGCPWSPPGYKP